MRYPELSNTLTNVSASPVSVSPRSTYFLGFSGLEQLDITRPLRFAHELALISTNFLKHFERVNEYAHRKR